MRMDRRIDEVAPGEHRGERRADEAGGPNTIAWGAPFASLRIRNQGGLVPGPGFR